MLVKDDLLDKVVDRIREQLPEDLAPQAEEFARQYYAWIPPEDLRDRSPVDIYGAAVAHWNFARQREPGSPKIRVYNPQFEEHGWQSTHTIVEMVNDDMPFLVDSTRMEINAQSFGIHLMLHPVMKIRRDPEGRLLEVLAPGSTDEDVISESVIHVEVDRQTETEVLEQLHACIEKVLGDVRAAVEDWPEMRAMVCGIASNFDEEAPPVEEDALAEAQAFLEWLSDDNFTFLGFRDYDLLTQNGEDTLQAEPDSGLGILREAGKRPVSRSFAKLSPEVRKLARTRRLLNLTKANTRATVHRPSYLDYVGVKKFDENGEVTGERRFLGLYTFSAYSASVLEIPLVRRKVRKVLERAGFPEGSHNEKDLMEILETHPRDELFQISEDELFEVSMGILHLQERHRVRLFMRRDTYGRFFSCLVYVPRDRYNTNIRHRMQGILQNALGGESTEYNVRLSESVLARIHFIIYTEPDHTPDYDVQEIEARLVETTRSWTDNLYDAVIEQCGEERGTELFRGYREAFPPGYRDDYLARTAVVDIRRIEELSSGNDLGMSLYHPLEAPEDFLRFRLYRLGGQISLSEVMPLLEHMGVEVADQRPYKIEPAAGGTPVWINDFGLVHEARGEMQTEQVKEIFQDAFARSWRGDVEDDGFNRLVLGARLTWREITVLRAYCKYLRQAGTTFSQRYMEETLAANPHIARLLVDLFKARFDPDHQQRAEQETERLTSEIKESLDAVTSLDEDRILARFLSVALATLRTNYFQSTSEGEPKPYLSFKLDPTNIPELPLPRPMFEIFVYSPEAEGIHLRGGEVARGGIRWSDRREDFRTEVLGLMKAQTVKNAVIVPVGAKGGFVVKQPPLVGGREALMQEVVACYRTLIRGMLDLTDNLDGDRVVPPPQVVRYDGDDPYLVVAADKGTATFSDLANSISAEYGFWLGDAFASGGSEGYDHKAMGITARGAWESVERHFRDLGINVQTTDFTVAGVGDMSGDVFGNGMLLSRHIKLTGAFNHQHVFLDPDPDPETSFEERKRLFGLPRSSWTDYDTSLISEGGGVFPRSAKSIPLSPEVRRLLGVEADSLTPNELINTLLKAPVDLLWNGGIGTYVKSSEETNAEVGDRANDALRADAAELRCRVIGEGGNLGFTQRGRIEYALGGGLVYMDAIDNSAGVDCSDHEVNIKILLDAIVGNGDMTGKQRNELLAEMTDEVGRLVLRDNYQQAQAIDQAVSLARPMLDVHGRYIHALEQSGRLNRGLEFLPGEEGLGERRSNGIGLTAPEFAILLSYSKITLHKELLASDAPEDPYLSGELERYFPTPLRERFREQMREHRLHREITATHVANSMVNRCGPSFAFRLGEETGATGPDIARAYTAAREIFDMRTLWVEIEALDNQVEAGVQKRMFLEGRKLVERATRWLLRNRRAPLDIAATISYFSEGAAELAGYIPNLLLDGDREALERETEQLIEAGVPPELANRAAILDPLFSALDIVDVAGATGQPLETVAAVYFTLGDRLKLHWLRDHIEALPRDNRWRTLARSALRDDVYSQQAALTAEILRSVPDELPARERIDAWVETNSGPVERALHMLSDINSSGTFDLSTLSVALREVRNLITSSGASPAKMEAPAR